MFAVDTLICCVIYILATPHKVACGWGGAREVGDGSGHPAEFSMEVGVQAETMGGAVGVCNQ